MSLISQTPLTALAEELITIPSLGKTAVSNITGSTSGKMYLLEIDNTANPDEDLYLKIADTNSATTGSSAYKLKFKIAANKKQTIVFPMGYEYYSGLSVWVTKTSPLTSTTGPSSNVIMKVLVTT
tara:strand:- start:236 stop:610 length:375 start_codon:yes stop_codon:yes gene_type:complete